MNPIFFSLLVEITSNSKYSCPLYDPHPSPLPNTVEVYVNSELHSEKLCPLFRNGWKYFQLSEENLALFSKASGLKITNWRFPAFNVKPNSTSEKKHTQLHISLSTCKCVYVTCAIYNIHTIPSVSCFCFCAMQFSLREYKPFLTIQQWNREMRERISCIERINKWHCSLIKKIFLLLSPFPVEWVSLGF